MLLKGQVNLIRAALPFIRQSDCGRIVNISSIAFLMTGKILKQGELKENDIFMSVLKNFSKPVLRSVIKQSINSMSDNVLKYKNLEKVKELINA